MVEKHFLELTFSIKGDRSVTLTYETLTNTATNETVALSKVLNASVDDSASMNLLGTFVAGQRGCIRVDMAKLGLARIDHHHGRNPNRVFLRAGGITAWPPTDN